jgi:Mesyanzhinovviridae DNA helicase
MYYETQMEPRAEQLEALRRLQGKQAFALLMAMRTGKTKTTLDDFGRLELAAQVQDLLVIAPGGVYRTWAKAWDEHISDDLKSRAKVYVWASDKRKSKSGKEELAAWLAHTGPRVLLVNVEALSSVKDARALCEHQCRSHQTMIVVDESTCIKNPKALRAKYIVDKLGPLARARRILSGLPTPRSPLDIFMQFKFLNPSILGFPNYYGFRAHYAVMRKERFNGRLVDIVVGYRNQEQLKATIAPHSYRVEFRPNIPSTYTITDVELTPAQRAAYAKMKELSTFQISKEQHVTATIVITQILKLHQILCGFVVDEQGTIHALPEHRTAKLLEVLDRGGGKAVIWCSYGESIRRVSKRLVEEFGAPSTACFWGGNTSVREEEEQRFLTDPDCQFMVATPHAGGKGRTWSVADLVVYHSSTNDLELRDQSEQRVQGVDKKRQVDYVDLIAPNTVEAKILTALRKKMNMAGMITGSNWREWVV